MYYFNKYRGLTDSRDLAPEYRTFPSPTSNSHALFQAMNEKVREEIQKRSVDNRLSCSVARKIAEDLSVSLRDIGRAADELKIKITDCELGCF